MYILMNESFSPVGRGIERKKQKMEGLSWILMNPPQHSVTEHNEKHLFNCWKMKCDPKKECTQQRNYCCLVTVSDSATPLTIAHQASLSTEFPRQEYWSVLPFPSPGDYLDPGIEPTSPALTGGLFTTEPPGKPIEIQLKYQVNGEAPLSIKETRECSTNVLFSKQIKKRMYNPLKDENLTIRMLVALNLFKDEN